MISYWSAYSSKRGGARFLGQDAVMNPTPSQPQILPTPEPYGNGLPGGPTPPPTGPSAAVAAPKAPPSVPAPAAPAASKGWTVTIGGKSIPGWDLVIAAGIVAGGIALITFTKSDIDKIYARKKK